MIFMSINPQLTDCKALNRTVKSVSIGIRLCVLNTLDTKQNSDCDFKVAVQPKATRCVFWYANIFCFCVESF